MRSRWVQVVAAVAVAIVVAVLVVVVSSQDPPPNGEQLLGRTQDFVADAESMEYRGASEISFDEGDGITFSEQLTFEGESEHPDRAHFVATSEFEGGSYTTETLFLEDDFYFREADDVDALDDEEWLLGDEFFVGSSAAPFDLTEVIADVSEPRILARGNGRVLLRVGVDFEDIDLQPIAGAVEPDGPMDLIITEDGRLEALRVTVEEASGTTTTTRIEFTTWNGDVDIEEPDEDDVDETPSIEEDVIADYDETTLYQPAAIPEDWLLGSAFVLPEEESTSGCDEVSLSFGDEEFLDPESPVYEGYLDLYQYPLTCLDGDIGEGDPFVAGPYTGVVDEEEDGYALVRIVVGETVVEVDTDLTLEELAVVLAELVALDVEDPPPATLELSSR